MSEDLRDFLLILRRALQMIVNWIERRCGVSSDKGHEDHEGRVDTRHGLQESLSPVRGANANGISEHGASSRERNSEDHATIP